MARVRNNFKLGILAATALLLPWSSSQLLAGHTSNVPLFASQEALNIEIPLSFNDLCRPREDQDCDYAPTTLRWEEPGGDSGTLPVEIIIRGGWRSMIKNCTSPLLFLRFDVETTDGTPFQGQHVLPLTTHCGRGLSIAEVAAKTRPSRYEQYLLKEYLGYRLYNDLTDVSLKVRLVNISYQQPDKPQRVLRSKAFISEHFAALAFRTDSTLLDRGMFQPEKLDAQAAGRLALFQYMLGNTDWSIVRQRNLILLKTDDGTQVPVPYDLDMAGLVNAHYAGPPPGLPIDEVTERYYLGYCHPDIDYDSLVAEFISLKPVFLDHLKQTQDLDRADRDRAKRFLQKFFNIIEDPESVREKIIEQCKAWPPDPEDHMIRQQ